MNLQTITCCALLVFAPTVIAQPVEGCFVSNPYEDDLPSVHDSFRVRKGSNNEYEIYVHNVHCGLLVSPDCANAKFEDYEYRLKWKDGKLTNQGSGSSCLIEIEFQKDGIAIFSSRGLCDANRFRSTPRSGVFRREDPNEILTACGYEH